MKNDPRKAFQKDAKRAQHGPQDPPKNTPQNGPRSAPDPPRPSQKAPDTPKSPTQIRSGAKNPLNHPPGTPPGPPFGVDFGASGPPAGVNFGPGRPPSGVDPGPFWVRTSFQNWFNKNVPTIPSSYFVNACRIFIRTSPTFAGTAHRLTETRITLCMSHIRYFYCAESS